MKNFLEQSQIESIEQKENQEEEVKEENGKEGGREKVGGSETGKV